MPEKKIKEFPDGSVLVFDKGRFDNWCVYIKQGLKRIPPRDTEYFRRFKELSMRYGAKTIYEDYISIYSITTSELREDVLTAIAEISSRYSEDCGEVEKLFTILYAGMVAEENKENAVLKKRVKRLGMHQTLIEGLDPEAAANFSKSKPWRELDKECKKRGF